MAPASPKVRKWDKVESIIADYLIMGAGAAGMAFADSVLTETEATLGSPTVGIGLEDTGTTPTPLSAFTSRPATTG